MLRILILLLILPISTPIHAETFKWVDDKGILHLSDKPPRNPKYLKQIKTSNNAESLLTNKQEIELPTANHIKTLLNDNFNDNKNNWWQTENELNVLKIKNGYYEIFKKNGMMLTWLKSFNLQESHDFEIEALISKTEGKDINTYGILFGLKNSANYFCFGITGDGQYRFFSKENDKYNYIIDYKKSEYIDKYNSTNKLKIQKTGNELMFYINDKFVDKSPLRSFFGKKVGFGVTSQIRAKADKITVNKIY